MVPHLADVLRSEAFHSHFPVLGDDYKVMGWFFNDSCGNGRLAV